ncbi:unnamed protein product, partial [Cyprideis torosa]
EEKELFLLLKTVNGVGPKLAQGILSGINVAEFCQAIAAKDVKRLTALQGVGKKMAERLCLDLKDKVANLAFGGAMGDEYNLAGDGAEEVSVYSDALSALSNLGYSDPLARRALETVKGRFGREVFGGMGFSEILKEALRELS